MATRGREANRLYVDTAHDPDHPTSHGQPAHAHPAELLRTVIATTGADTSATHVRQAENNRPRGQPGGSKPKTQPLTMRGGRPRRTCSKFEPGDVDDRLSCAGRPLHVRAPGFAERVGLGLARTRKSARWPG